MLSLLVMAALLPAPITAPKKIATNAAYWPRPKILYCGTLNNRETPKLVCLDDGPLCAPIEAFKPTAHEDL